jgi:rhodanese-related sulfurtransferase
MPTLRNPSLPAKTNRIERPAGYRSAAHAAAAIHIPRWTLSGKIGTVVPDKTARIVLYCLGGVRPAAAAASLQKMGYTNVFSLTGGFKNYQLAGLPIRKWRLGEWK